MASKFTDIPYTTSPIRDKLKEFDYYKTDGASDKPLICFVHGGAWRSEDKSDWSTLAQNLASSTGFSVVVPNYRLSPTAPDVEPLRHPAHAEDIKACLTFLLTWERPKGDATPGYNPASLYLIGHSCSAHMLSSIFLDSSAVYPSLTPSIPLLDAVQAIIVSEGIYDIDALLGHFPDYRAWFIANTFGSQSSYTQDAVSRLPLRKSTIQWLVLHSRGDTLVNEHQSNLMVSHLRELYGARGNTHMIMADLETLSLQHNDILKDQAYVSLVAKFILEDVSTHIT